METATEMYSITTEMAANFTPDLPVSGCNNNTNYDPNTAVCNITCCNFGDGCVVDFSKMNITPWVRLDAGQLALFGCGVAMETVPGILGNILVILIILGNRIMRNDINMFILNMAVADLITAAVLPPTFFIQNAFQAYELGPTWCCYGESFRLTLLLASVFSLVVVSIDRLWGLMRPFHRQFQPTTTLTIMLATWVCALAIAAYPATLKQYMMRQYADFLDISCEDKSQMKMYWWLIAIFLVWLPAFILLGCFLLIFVKLRSLNVHQKSSGQLRFVPPITESRKRAVRLVFCMLISFIVCWSPFLVYVLLYQYSPQNSNAGMAIKVLYYVSHFMIYLVPVINPLLYALMHENFRRAATVVLPCLPAKVKYRAFRTGTGPGTRVHWSVRGQSLPPRRPSRSVQSVTERAPRPHPKLLRRSHTLSEFPPVRHQSDATDADVTTVATAVIPEIAVTSPEEMVTSQGGDASPSRHSRLDDSRMREVTLIWNALMESQLRDQQQMNFLSVKPLEDIVEESESRKTSIVSSIDLGEVIKGAAKGGRKISSVSSINSAYVPE